MATKWNEIRRQHSPKVEAGIRRLVENAAQVMDLYAATLSSYMDAFPLQSKVIVQELQNKK